MSNKHLNWVALFYMFWLGPMVIGFLSVFLKIVNVIDVYWWVAVTPIIFSYAFFAIVVFYVAFIHKKLTRIVKKYFFLL